MEILAAVTLIALGAIVACAFGRVVGPLVLALGFGLLGIGLLGTYQLGPAIGVAYLGGSAFEVAAANAYRRSHGRPSTGWAASATVVGIAGSIGLVALLYGLLAFMAWLSAIS